MVVARCRVVATTSFSHQRSSTRSALINHRETARTVSHSWHMDLSLSKSSLDLRAPIGIRVAFKVHKVEARGGATPLPRSIETTLFCTLHTSYFTLAVASETYSSSVDFACMVLVSFSRWSQRSSSLLLTSGEGAMQMSKIS
jgi:hypothetical protein